MGTSGAFGGSKTAGWNEVAGYIADLQGGLGGHGVAPPKGFEAGQDYQPDDGAPDEHEGAPASKLADLVAKALQDDDPSLKPKNAPARQPGDSGLTYGGLVGNPRRRGSSRAGTRSGRRQIAASAGRAGRAVGAGYALATGNAAALADYGLDLNTLQGMSKIDQIFAIMEAVELGNSGPDDVALRGALYDVLDRVLSDDPNIAPVETLRELMCEYAAQLFAVELDALVEDGKLEVTQRTGVFNALSEVIGVDAANLDLDGANLTNPQQFEHAAQQVMRATLAIVRGGDAT